MKDACNSMFDDRQFCNEEALETLPKSGHPHSQRRQTDSLESIGRRSRVTRGQQLVISCLCYPTDTSTYELLRALRSSDQPLHLEIIHALELLGKHAPSRAIIALEGALRDGETSENTRVAVAEVLSQVGGKAQKTALLLSIADRSWRVRAAVIRALGALGEDAPLETIEISLKYDEDETVRETALWTLQPLVIQAIEQQKNLAPFRALLSALNDTSEIVRAAATEALGRLDNLIPVGPLITALYDEHELVRAAAVEALGNLGEQAPLEHITRALSDEHELVRATAVRILGAFGKRAPIELLILTLKDQEDVVREEAIASLGKLYKHICQQASTAFLLSSLKDENEDIQAIAAWVIGERHEHVALRAISHLLEDHQSFLVQTAAQWAKGQLSKDSHIDEDVDVRAMLSKALGSIRLQLSAEDVLCSLFNFLKGKKGYIVMETPSEQMVIVKCYYQKGMQSVQDVVLNPRRGYTRVEHLESALMENNTTIQEIARQILEKRDLRPWDETFMISVDLLERAEGSVEDDIPTKMVVCSTSYSQVRANDTAISQSLKQYCHQDGQNSRRICDWIDLFKKPFQYAQRVKDVKIWYGTEVFPQGA